MEKSNLKCVSLSADHVMNGSSEMAGYVPLRTMEINKPAFSLNLNMKNNGIRVGRPKKLDIRD